MKISILTPTYNRGDLLGKLFNSLIINLDNYKYDELFIEWLIMDDGSSDDTKIIVERFKQELETVNNKFKDLNRKIEIKYFYQENQGKMVAINNLIEHVTGDYIVDCDSDDYFIEYAFNVIKKALDENEDEKGLYGLGFLKYDEDRTNVGNNYMKDGHISTMFDMYFKEGLTGEKVIVFYAGIRKKFRHILEEKEKFITEARMYHEVDLQYKLKGYNIPVTIGDYLADGYTKNIVKQFKENPKGYYKYFEEMFKHDMKGVTLKKRMYIIKHFILFSTLTEHKITKERINEVQDKLNRFLYVILYYPGRIKTKKMFKMK